jgi:hypothetical protein
LLFLFLNFDLYGGSFRFLVHGKLNIWVLVPVQVLFGCQQTNGWHIPDSLGAE